MTPQEIAREKTSAINAVSAMALLMLIWAAPVWLNGGFTAQPEHHAMWRGTAALCGCWGVVLLLCAVCFRGSTSYWISAGVIAGCGFYLASAPTI